METATFPLLYVTEMLSHIIKESNREWLVVITFQYIVYFGAEK